ncbi:hypothetical protein [Homoserinibacter sp. GY 40078]|uniref:hypothetical protein n=1 Tax=Homoserinibacter sp. GY 40078 TaxID=2603275 RepID=UPI0011C822C0|nr:hypothetical protein [Homoserinibacter sp. GY 40078]TXK19832.1 hypothetical protein FVQ89_08240 [Homoserinibacter sp. GY 40078]
MSLRSLARTGRGLLAATVLVAALAACTTPAPVATPTATPDPTATSAQTDELVGTTWAGVDSDGDRWSIEFQADGTIGLGYAGSTFDDDTDVWSHDDDTVMMRIAFADGDLVMLGQYEGLGEPMRATGTFADGDFTVDLELQ